MAGINDVTLYALPRHSNVRARLIYPTRLSYATPIVSCHPFRNSCIILKASMVLRGKKNESCVILYPSPIMTNYRIESRHPPGKSRHNYRYQRYDKLDILY
jgi:hypothetical protein